MENNGSRPPMINGETRTGISKPPYLKYYTPTINEFRPLFQYEWLNNEGKWQEHRFRTDSKNNTEKYNLSDSSEFIDGGKNLHRQIFKYIEEGRIRVKYLNKEDILDLGLESIPNEVESPWIKFIGTITMMKKEFEVILSYFPPMPKNEDLLEYRDPMVKLEGRIAHVFPYVTIFNDCIKNKSELKHLLTKERTNIMIVPPEPKRNEQ